jgi:hypothetical protein
VRPADFAPRDWTKIDHGESEAPTAGSIDRPVVLQPSRTARSIAISAGVTDE